MKDDIAGDWNDCGARMALVDRMEESPDEFAAIGVDATLPPTGFLLSGKSLRVGAELFAMIHRGLQARRAFERGDAVSYGTQN